MTTRGCSRLAMLGRVSLLRGDHVEATEILAASGDADAASRTLEQSFARACQIGDYCWQGISARGLALLAEAGAADQAPWAAAMLNRASRTGMRELTVRAMLPEAACPGTAGTPRRRRCWQPTSTTRS